MNVTCQTYLLFESGLRATIPWGWKPNVEDFLHEAVARHPSLVRVSLDYGGDEVSMIQGDLHWGTWEKHDGKWHRLHYADCFEVYYENKPLLTLVPAPELDAL